MAAGVAVDAGKTIVRVAALDDGLARGRRGRYCPPRAGAAAAPSRSASPSTGKRTSGAANAVIDSDDSPGKTSSTDTRRRAFILGRAPFVDHLPLYRQESIFKRHGVELPRSTLCEWKLASGELLAVLRSALIAHTLSAPRLHSDDTTMPLIVGGRGSTKTARLWGYLGAGARRNEAGEWVEHPAAVVFEFTESRESMHPIKFLKQYQGYLQADAYSGYDALYRTGRIIEVGCWAHCRRKNAEPFSGGIVGNAPT